MILIIDNYDSFVHNLARYFRLLGCETRVVRNDSIPVNAIAQLAPEAIVLSPGPCTPRDAGICLDVVRVLGQQIPILGICLGHQAIIEAFGGTVDRALEPVHGRASSVWHVDSPMFKNVASPFIAGRYHSLVGLPDHFPEMLQVTARCEDQAIMAVEHLTLPVVGLQFHPESILTQSGFQILANFLDRAGLPHRPAAELGDRETRNPTPADRAYPVSPRLTVKETP